MCSAGETKAQAVGAQRQGGVSAMNYNGWRRGRVHGLCRAFKSGERILILHQKKRETTALLLV